MTSPLQAGSEIGGYRITGMRGRGGMATVYTALRISDQLEVALKVMAEGLADRPQFRSRFARETRYARSVDHPNVVRILDSGDDEGVLWAAMDLIEGRDLAAIIAADGPLEPERALRIIGQTADALDAVHAAGLLHRDVKPANVLVEPADIGERAFLTDFGLGKDPGTDSRALTAAGYFVGTSHYCAPEQILARGNIDRRADVYSLGCVLFECLTGGPPFVRDRETDVLHAHVQDPPPTASGRREELATAIDEVLATAMAKDPDARYESCAALLGAARSALSPPAPPDHEQREPTPVAVADEGVLRLEVVRGRAAGATIEVTGELVIGRGAGGAGALGEDQEISRRHARIWRDRDRGWMIEDLGSTNGSFVGGRRISGPEPLGEGDVIEVGSTTLRVAACEPSRPTPASPAPPTPESTPQSIRVAPDPGAVPPPLSLRLEIDFEGREARIGLDEGSEPIRLVYADGSWRLRER